MDILQFTSLQTSFIAYIHIFTIHFKAFTVLSKTLHELSQKLCLTNPIHSIYPYIYDTF